MTKYEKRILALHKFRCNVKTIAGMTGATEKRVRDVITAWEKWERIKKQLSERE